MELLVFLLDEFFVDVGVNLRGADVGVSEKFLQNAEVHSRFEAMGGKLCWVGWRFLADM